MTAYRFAILACSASKLTRRAPAHELYTGDLFQLSLKLARATSSVVLVLSAKYGVVGVDDELDPYDQSLAGMPKHQRAIWGEQVAQSLLRRFGIKDRTNIREGDEVGKNVLCLAPQSYVKSIGHLYGVSRWVSPLKGLGIGQQKLRLQELCSSWCLSPRGPTVAEQVLKLEAAFPGDADAAFELDAVTWLALVEAARREVAP